MTEAQAAILGSRVVKRIFAKQPPDGYWGDPITPYQADYTHQMTISCLTDALDVLHQKRLANGRWVLESTPYGRMQAGLEKKGQPSKWVTLKALEVLEQAERQTLGNRSVGC
jgi:hypothetical protein